MATYPKAELKNHTMTVDEAGAATSKEHELTLRQGLKAYRKAILWSVLLSMAVIMEGYGRSSVSCWSGRC